MVDETTIAEAIMKTPEWVILEGNPNSLCYHIVETTSDLVNLIRYLTLVTRKEADEADKAAMNPNIVNKAAFRFNEEFYYLEVEAIFNIPGDYYSINADLYRYLNNNADTLPPVLIWEEDKSRIGVPCPFDDLVESLKEDLEVEHSSLSEIPDDIQRLLKLKRPESPEDVEQQVTYYTYFER